MIGTADGGARMYGSPGPATPGSHDLGTASKQTLLNAALLNAHVHDWQEFDPEFNGQLPTAASFANGTSNVGYPASATVDGDQGMAWGSGLARGYCGGGVVKGYADGTSMVGGIGSAISNWWNGSNTPASNAVNSVTPQGRMVGGFTNAFGNAMSAATGVGQSALGRDPDPMNASNPDGTAKYSKGGMVKPQTFAGGTHMVAHGKSAKTPSKIDPAAAMALMSMLKGGGGMPAPQGGGMPMQPQPQPQLQPQPQPAA